MSNQIRLKRGSGSDPSASDLAIGELAIRTDNGKIFTKRDNGNVTEITGGGGIDDGDKGDITVSNSGATFTIDDNAVTLAKMQNVITDTILGRTTNGTGDLEVLSPSSVRGIINVEDGATADQTASEILTLIKTVDGAGSGLDADTLDGISSASFLRSDTNTLLNGILTVGGSSVSGGEGGELRLTYAPNGSLSGSNLTVDVNNNNFRIFEDGGNNRGVFLDLSTCSNSASGKLYHDGNDGAGSGLDADLLDGLQGSSFLRSDANDTTSGNLNIGGTLDVTGKVDCQSGLETDGDVKFNSGTTNMNILFDASEQSLEFDDGVKAKFGNSFAIFHDGNNTYLTEHGDGTGQVYLRANSIELLNNSNETYAKFITDGAVELYHNDTKRFETTSSGGTLTGNLAVTGTVDGRDLATDGSKLDGIAASATNVTNTNQLTNGAGFLTSVATSNIANDAVTNDKLADDSVDAAQIIDNAVRTQHILANQVTATEIANTTIIEGNIANDAVSNAKLANIQQNRVIGRISSGTGDPEYLTGASLRTICNVENGATADQTNSEIKTAYEANSNTNAFTDALLSKLNGIAASATNVTNNNQISNGAGYITSADGGNAATLDGIDSSQFLRSDANDSATGTLTTRDIKISAGYHLQRSDHHSGHLEGSYNNVGANSYKTNPIYSIGSSYNPNDAALNNFYGVGYTHTNASFISFTGASGWGFYVAADGDARVYLDGSNGVVSSTGQHYVGSNVVWNAGNDGSGSGLDSDLLDGQHGSYYSNYNNLSNKPTIPTNNNQLTNGAGYITSSSAGIPASGGTFTGDIGVSGGAGALTVNAGSDIRFTVGNWTGNAYGKIQHHSNALYIAGGSSNDYSFIFRYNDGDKVYIRSNGTIYPANNNSADLGLSSKRWANLYVQDMHFSNNETNPNKVDGTWGDWTLQEGEDQIYMLNNRNGKKYKMNLTEIV